MCRYSPFDGDYKEHYACFACRRAFRRMGTNFHNQTPILAVMSCDCGMTIIYPEDTQPRCDCGLSY
jgi:hypothetical protein